MKLKKWAIVLGAVVALTFVGREIFKLVMMGPRDYWGMVRYDQRQEGKLRVGDPAPDVVVAGLDGAPVHLHERLGGRPVVLVFGSYT
jgi:hypothetical protein